MVNLPRLCWGEGCGIGPYIKVTEQLPSGPPTPLEAFDSLSAPPNSPHAAGLASPPSFSPLPLFGSTDDSGGGTPAPS